MEYHIIPCALTAAGGEGGSPAGVGDEEAAVPFLSPAAPFKQNSDALSTFPILLFCVSKCKQGGSWCDRQWDTR